MILAQHEVLGINNKSNVVPLGTTDSVVHTRHHCKQLSRPYGTCYTDRSISQHFVLG